jgi:hypothetical protein
MPMIFGKGSSAGGVTIPGAFQKKEDTVKVIAKIHELDREQVNIIDDDRKFLICTVHIDSLYFVGPGIIERLELDSEIELEVTEWSELSR